MTNETKAANGDREAGVSERGEAAAKKEPRPAQPSPLECRREMFAAPDYDLEVHGVDILRRQGYGRPFYGIPVRVSPLVPPGRAFLIDMTPPELSEWPVWDLPWKSWMPFDWRPPHPKYGRGGRRKRARRNARRER